MWEIGFNGCILFHLAMISPTNSEVMLAKDIIIKSLEELVKYDSDIINMGSWELEGVSEDAKALNRELHETTINHRFAYYIENFIKKEYLYYHVDIEYNRLYQYQKLLWVNDVNEIVRPDIVVHSRINREIKQQHFLVVEAKKQAITEHDVNKVKAFIEDKRYNYLFGLTVSYCQNPKFIIAELYWWNGEVVLSEKMVVPKAN